MKLAACWIWGSPFVWTRSVESMLGLRHPAGYDVRFFRGAGWGPAKRHMNACEAAVTWGADWILILGADQVYEPDLLERLTARVENGFEGNPIDVVAALVPSRGYLGYEKMKPFQPMAWRIPSNGLNPVAWDRESLIVLDPKDGEMQRADFVGSGVLMFHRDVLLSLAKPWFFEAIDHATQTRTASMDTRFAYRLRAEGNAQVWVDTTIKVRHLHAFEIDETFQERFADWETPGVGDLQICRYEEPPNRPQLVRTG